MRKCDGHGHGHDTLIDLHDMPSDARAFSLTSFEAYSSFCCQIRLLGSLFLSKEPQDLNN